MKSDLGINDGCWCLQARDKKLWQELSPVYMFVIELFADLAI